MRRSLTRILNVIVDILVVFILIVSVFTLVVSLSSRVDGVPNIFGKAPFTVMSGSMEPTLNVGDLIISERVQYGETEYQVGDIVTFPIELDDEIVYNTHRIVEIVNEDGSPYESGTKYYRTQGDNKKTNPVADEDLQTDSSIVAIYRGTKIAGVGNIFSFLRTQMGFFLVILLPMIIFFIYEAIRVVINLLAYNKEKAVLAAQEVINSSELTEEQKAKAIAEYLAQQGANAPPKVEEKPVEEASEEKAEEAHVDEPKAEE